MTTLLDEVNINAMFTELVGSPVLPGSPPVSARDRCRPRASPQLDREPRNLACERLAMLTEIHEPLPPPLSLDRQEDIEYPSLNLHATVVHDECAPIVLVQVAMPITAIALRISRPDAGDPRVTERCQLCRI